MKNLRFVGFLVLPFISFSASAADLKGAFKAGPVSSHVTMSSVKEKRVMKVLAESLSDVWNEADVVLTLEDGSTVRIKGRLVEDSVTHASVKIKKGCHLSLLDGKGVSSQSAWLKKDREDCFKEGLENLVHTKTNGVRDWNQLSLMHYESFKIVKGNYQQRLVRFDIELQ